MAACPPSAWPQRRELMKPNCNVNNRSTIEKVIQSMSTHQSLSPCFPKRNRNPIRRRCTSWCPTMPRKLLARTEFWKQRFDCIRHFRRIQRGVHATNFNDPVHVSNFKHSFSLSGNLPVHPHAVVECSPQFHD
jgi:hypothetical protein